MEQEVWIAFHHAAIEGLATTDRREEIEIKDQDVGKAIRLAAQLARPISFDEAP
jgi:hypothetical protein